MTRIIWTAGWNIPGCLPNPDSLFDFDSFEGARNFLVQEIDFRWDGDEWGDAITRERAGEKWLDLHTALHNAGGPTFEMLDGLREHVFWIEQNESL